jgi:16S rRNA (cytosine1402-N4)-methyltransferase
MHEAIEALTIKEVGVYIDATFGRGGHSRSILKQLKSKGRLLVIDQDPDAIATAVELEKKDSRLELRHALFGSLRDIAQEKGIFGKVDGVLFDLGVSSPQLDQAERGFSFMRDGPLDMRMNPTEGISAAQWVNKVAEKEIADVLFQYGEEKHSRRIARRIVEERKQQPIETTVRLAEIVKEANPSWERGKHPATRAFQGIRIFINRELDELKLGLGQALEVLNIGGRLVVISFHSLEDRIVKRFIARQSKGDIYPRDLPVPQSLMNPRLKPIGKTIRASSHEIDANPRARSAIMRVAEKIA